MLQNKNCSTLSKLTAWNVACFYAKLREIHFLRTCGKSGHIGQRNVGGLEVVSAIENNLWFENFKFAFSKTYLINTEIQFKFQNSAMNGVHFVKWCKKYVAIKVHGLG